MSGINLTTKPHPIKADSSVHNFSVEGKTILEMIDDTGVDIRFADSFRCWIDGSEIPKKFWGQVKPKEGSNVVIAAVAGSSDSQKDGLRMVATIAVIAAAPMAGAAIGSVMGWGATGISIATSVVGIAGQLAINAAIPPPKPERSRSDVGRSGVGPTITGDANQANPYGPIPRVLGKYRMHPMLAAQTFTETQGGDQYYRMLLTCGYGPVDISDIRIGQTKITEYEDVEIEIREGRPGDSTTGLYSNQVRESQEQVSLSDDWMTEARERFEGGGAELDLAQNPESVFRVERRQTRSGSWRQISRSDYQLNASGNLVRTDGDDWAMFTTGSEEDSDLRVYDAWRVTYVYQTGAADGWTARTSETDTDEITIDVTFPRGLVRFEDGGGRAVEEMWLQVQTKADGDSSWTELETRRITNDQPSRFAAGFRKVFESRGQHDIRVRRLTPDRDSDQVQEQTVLSAVRSITDEDPVQIDTPVSLIALRIRASDQLQGRLDSVNCLAQSYGMDYDIETETWVDDKLLENPAALYRMVLQDDANSRAVPVSDIDIESLETWYENAKNDGYTYSAVIDYRDTVHELLQEIASVGRASFTMKDGKFGVVEDRPQPVPVQHFTPRNSWGFTAEKSFVERPDAWRVKFMNAAQGYQEDERIIYDEGQSEETAEVFEDMEFPGATKADHVYKLGIYQIAQARLRPELYKIKTDVEHVACSRGDLVRLTHDVPLIGQGSARIRDVVTEGADVTQIRIDEAWTRAEGDDHAVRIRLMDGTSVEREVLTEPDEKNLITFSEPITEPNLKPEGGELVMFGIKGSESGEFIVRRVLPKDELAAEIELVDYSPAIFEVDAPPIPEFETNVTAPDAFRAPRIEEIRSDRDVLFIDETGGFDQQIVISLQVRNVDYDSISHYDLEIKADGSGRWIRHRMDPDQREIRIRDDIVSGTLYQIRIRSVDDLGFTSTWRQRQHQTVGDTSPPDDVENFNLQIKGGTATLSWDPVDNDDLAFYRIRFSHQVGGSIGWNNGSIINNKIPAGTNEIQVDAIQGTYMIKAVDFGGRTSENETIVATDFGGIEGLIALETIKEDPEWAGTRNNVTEIAGDLALVGSDTIGDWPQLAEIDTIAMGTEGIVNSGSYVFEDRFELANVGQIRLTKDIEAFGELLSNQIRWWGELREIESIGSAHETEWDVTVEFRHTQEANPAEGDFSAWQVLTLNEVEARIVEFRIIMESFKQNVRPRINNAETELDIEERVESESDITIPEGGKRVDFPNPFLLLSGIGVTLNDSQSGDNWQITNKDTEGFNIEIKNGSDPVSRVVDYLAKGGGAVVEV